jgi:uncharacterized protein YcaQ
MSKQSHYTITPTTARRLAVHKQRLAGERAPATSAGILDVVRDIGCLQLDPISAVARSHTLVVWSRVGNYDLAELNRLLWEDRHLFEYWAHAASIVLTEDYPIHHALMRSYGEGDSGWHVRVRDWIEQNRLLHDYILGEIAARGPVASRDLEEAGKDPKAWVSTGWTSGRNVSRMLDFLWLKGKIAVAGRKGGQKLWDLSERCLPALNGNALTDEEIDYKAAQKSLRALGIARMQHIKVHYIRGRYRNLNETLRQLEKEGQIRRVEIAENGATFPGPWFIHKDDLPLLESLERDEWQPRTTLLSPFDNLICDRARTELLFDFNYRIEIYVPKDKRQYGYYVLPILHGDRLIGRIDPLMNRKLKRLEINNVYAEPGAPAEAGAAVRTAIEELGAWLGAKDIAISESVPEIWRGTLSGD